MKDVSKTVREIYHKQHRRRVNDKISMERFINIYSTDYFKLPKNYFKGKKVLDAGCGSTGYLIISLHRMCSTDIHGIDLDTNFITSTQQSLRNFKVPLNDVTLQTGNILKIPYDDSYFDFTCCNGVLAHLHNLDEVKKAIGELSRVTKPNGFLYISSGSSNSTAGLLENVIVPATRSYYENNVNFKKFIDKLSPKDFHQIIDFISEKMEKHTNEKIFLENIKPLLDVDFCVTIQDILQTPLRLTFPEGFILKQYEQHGFRQIKRLKKYVMRKNIRKFTAPLHYYTNNKISKILYGTGYHEYIAKKNNRN